MTKTKKKKGGKINVYYTPTKKIMDFEGENDKITRENKNVG